MTRRRMATKSRRFWTADEDALLRARFPDAPTHLVAAALGRSTAAVSNRAAILGLRKSAAYLASPAAGTFRPGHASAASIAARFQPGLVPANKGLRRPGYGPGRMKTTQFKPGNRTGKAAQNWCPIGTIRVDHGGYQRIKVREAVHGQEPTGFGNVRVWPLLQRWLWTQAHGPIPPGYAVCFRDGDRAHCVIENLELVARRDLMRRNSIHTLPAPLVGTIRLLGALNRKLRRTARGQKQDQ